LERAIERHNVHWHWVKGHADNELNNRADELARAAIKTLAL
jgi:ribonuclease HI